MPDITMGDLMAMVKQAGGSDPLDFTDQYNTPIPANRQQEFKKWRASLPPQLRSQRDYDVQGAFLNGSNPDFRQHMTDDFKKPNHATFSNGSLYHGIDGYTGGEWTPQGFRPSPTNLSFRSVQDLQKYFSEVEKKTPLLPAVPVPAPAQGGSLTIADLMKYGAMFQGGQ